MSIRIAILGAGPIGIEAALSAAQRGHDVHVYERDTLAAHVRDWSHVTLFSPWSMNRSARGEALLTESGVTLEPGALFPTGAEFVSRYLEPLAAHPSLAGRIHTQHEVLGVARAHALKGEFIGKAERAHAPFLISLVDAHGEERFERADVVIDTTGSYRQAATLGPGGLRAPGESEVADRITHYVPDLQGTNEELYRAKRVLVVGAGYSAVTTLRTLSSLHVQHPNTHVTWLRRSQHVPYEVIQGDVLPQRAALAAFGNVAASGEVAGIVPVDGAQIMRLESVEQGRAVCVHYTDAQGNEHKLIVDRIVANVGYRPDTELYRELQVHLCYASEGPMKLAAALLAAGGGGGDCLTQTSSGPETLLNPEPNFFILGSKSYGRGSAFLLKLGHTQVEEMMGLIE